MLLSHPIPPYAAHPPSCRPRRWRRVEEDLGVGLRGRGW
jgi:hypothetical protein